MRSIDKTIWDGIQEVHEKMNDWRCKPLLLRCHSEAYEGRQRHAGEKNNVPRRSNAYINDMQECVQRNWTFEI